MSDRYMVDWEVNEAATEVTLFAKNPIELRAFMEAVYQLAPLPIEILHDLGLVIQQSCVTRLFYLNLLTDAVFVLLGAILGYLFNRWFGERIRRWLT